MQTQLYAGCESCKGLFQDVQDGTRGTSRTGKGSADRQDPREHPVIKFYPVNISCIVLQAM